MRLNPDQVVEGVKDGVWGWMSEHSVTAPECIMLGVEKAVAEWLKDHGEDVITAAVRRVLADRDV